MASNLGLPDRIVLSNLLRDADGSGTDDQNSSDIDHLAALNKPGNLLFTPSVSTLFDETTGALWVRVRQWILPPVVDLAMKIVRHPTDVVFLNHAVLYLGVNLPSAIWLFHHFTLLHGIAHLIFTLRCIGPFTLMLHNHIHNGGILSKRFAWADLVFPYILGPLFGHTWDSYYLHHVKHHHVENNGPDDLSTTIRMQRDDPRDFARYVARFVLLVWIELPLYFVKKHKPLLAGRAFLSEALSMAFLYYSLSLGKGAAWFTLIMPFVLLRLGLMCGNWGQHAFVDASDPTSDYRCSLTLLDNMSNQQCFNDGYHTAHHLNPRRHWRDHPAHLVRCKDAYKDGQALIFQDIDFLGITFKLLSHDYTYLARHLVPIGNQVDMSQAEIASMLKSRARKLTEEEIQDKFAKIPRNENKPTTFARNAGNVRCVSRVLT